MNFFTKSQIFLFIIIFSIFTTSCATNLAITDTKEIQEYQMLSTDSDKVQIEFIGYKADTNLLSTASETIRPKLYNTREIYTVMSPFDQWKAISQTYSLRRIGSILQDKNIANDQSFAYFGIYSLQELELYKSKTRYVTFIEVVDNKYSIKEKGLNNQYKKTLGSITLGGGIIYHILGIVLFSIDDNAKANGKNKLNTALQIGGLCLDAMGLIELLTIEKQETTIIFNGAYNIYVYDTQVKEIIYKDTVTINSNDTFTGSYLMFDESKNVISDYYGKIICNEILKKYDSINQWLKTRE